MIDKNCYKWSWELLKIAVTLFFGILQDATVSFSEDISWKKIPINCKILKENSAIASDNFQNDILQFCNV